MTGSETGSRLISFGILSKTCLDTLFVPFFYSATYLNDEDDSKYVNQQGVHDLFADILFADTEDCDADNDNSSSDEDAILSSSKSLEEWSEEMEYNQEEKPRINSTQNLQPKVFKKLGISQE